MVLSFAAVSVAFTAAQTSNAPLLRPKRGQRQPREIVVTQYSLPPDKLAKAEALYKIRTVLYLIGLFSGIAILWLLLQLRIAPRFRDLAELISKSRFVQTIIFVPLLLLAIALLVLPIEIYGHHVSLSYGLSVQAWPSWMADWAKAQAVSTRGFCTRCAHAFLDHRKSPQRWWLYFWLLTLPFAVLLIFVAPVILDPMFNHFAPLEKTQPLLVSEIEKVTQRGGLNIPRDRMFEMEASAKVTTYNAYVTGIGATKRVVVWDNTARDLTIPETLFVFGHEMGHYVLNHIFQGLAFYAVTSFLGFWLGRRMVLAMLSRWGSAWRIRGLNDLAALPVLDAGTFASNFYRRTHRQRLQPPHRTSSRYLWIGSHPRPFPRQFPGCGIFFPEARGKEL